MPSPTRKSKILHLLTTRDVDTETPIGVAATFKTVYSNSLFIQRIADPNLSERAAREEMKRSGWVELWDRSRYSTAEEAKYSPTGSMAIISRIKVLTR